MDVKNLSIKELEELTKSIESQIRRKKNRIRSCFRKKAESLAFLYSLTDYDDASIFLNIERKNEIYMENLSFRIFNYSEYFPVHVTFLYKQDNYTITLNYDLKIGNYFVYDKTNRYLNICGKDIDLLLEDRKKDIIPIIKNILDRKLLSFYKTFKETNIIQTLDTIYLIRKFRSSQLSRLNKDEFFLLTRAIYNSYF